MKIEKEIICKEVKDIKVILTDVNENEYEADFKGYHDIHWRVYGSEYPIVTVDNGEDILKRAIKNKWIIKTKKEGSVNAKYIVKYRIVNTEIRSLHFLKTIIRNWWTSKTDMMEITNKT